MKISETSAATLVLVAPVSVANDAGTEPAGWVWAEEVAEEIYGRWRDRKENKGQRSRLTKGEEEERAGKGRTYSLGELSEDVGSPGLSESSGGSGLGGDGGEEVALLHKERREQRSASQMDVTREVAGRENRWDEQ